MIYKKNSLDLGKQLLECLKTSHSIKCSQHFEGFRSPEKRSFDLSEAMLTLKSFFHALVNASRRSDLIGQLY